MSKAIRIHNYGGPEALIEEDVTLGDPGSGQVRVRVHATTLNHFDVMRASGVASAMFPLQFPWIPGSDLSGTVEKIGEDVSDLHVGDEIYGFPIAGSYAEQILIDASSIALKPKNLSHAEAASISMIGQTAWQALGAAGLASGQTILVHGGGGAVGSAAIQLAKLRGAHVISTASSADAEYVRSLGADEVLDYKTGSFETAVKNVDVVLDTIGGDTQQKSFGVLKPSGVLVALNQFPSQEEAAKHGVKAIMVNANSNTKDLKALKELVEAGHLKVLVGKTYPLSQAADAWRESESKHVKGKVVLIVTPN